MSKSASMPAELAVSAIPETVAASPLPDREMGARVRELGKALAEALSHYDLGHWRAVVYASNQPRSGLCLYQDGADDPDAELRRLGLGFERQREAMQPVVKKSREVDARWHSEIDRRGLSFSRDRRDIRVVSEEVGHDAAIDAASVELEKLSSIVRQIHAVPPKTIHGLAVWAMVTKEEAIPLDHVDRQYREMDWEVECVARMCDAIIAMSRS